MSKIFDAFLMMLFPILLSFLPLSAITSSYSTAELAEGFIQVLVKSTREPCKLLQQQSQDRPSEARITICSKCHRSRNSNDNSTCPCCTCPNCGGYYGTYYQKHYPNCFCHNCGCEGGFHINCWPRDWQGLEEHDFETTIALTTEAIANNPHNRTAYFYRGVAYFELGKFDAALEDYIASGKGEYLNKSLYQASKEFTSSFLLGVFTGAKESVTNFLPSLCNTTYGIGRTLWTAVQHPIDSSLELSNACYEAGECVFEYCRNLDWEKLESYSEHFKGICQEFKNLNESEKGELIGYIIGRYGTEAFTWALAGSATVKGAQALQNIKNANRICNLEAMAISGANREIMVSAVSQHINCRKNYFNTVQYNYGSHYKHVVDHNNYIPGRSIWEHNDPERLLRTFAGKGRPESGIQGMPGYKETVNFGEHIGIWKSHDGTLELPTMRGTIHYGKNGAHIVPANPNPKRG